MTHEQLLQVKSPYRDLEHWLHYTDHLPAYDKLRDKPANLSGVCVPWPTNKLKY